MRRSGIEPVRRILRRQAAPAGGADIPLRMAVWGCLLGSITPLFATELPSGLSVSLMETRYDEMGAETWLRFRFLAPAVGSVSFADVEADMAHLCETTAVPYVSDNGVSADRVVISLSDRPLAFGTTDPEATQFFETFRVEQGRCIWEGL